MSNASMMSEACVWGHESRHHLDPYIGAILSGQDTTTARMIARMEEGFAKISVETKQNKTLLEQLRQGLTETLLRMDAMHASVRAVLTQTYELHEYPIPRLFIVLPKPISVADRLQTPFTKHFRLYFLCECSNDTASRGDDKTQHVHLAKHEGYDIERPSEFFEKYGAYVLTMLHMIKFGITAAGFVVPSLASLRLQDRVEAIQDQFKSYNDNLGTVLDNMIAFIQKSGDIEFEAASFQSERRGSEVLEGADLRQLESYLKAHDDGRVLGNLYRIVTQEGHVKWVCLDHYRKNYREADIIDLRRIVKSNNGVFIEEKGRIEITLASQRLAKQFYDALVRAPRTHELEITLQWHVTTHELEILCDAVSKANIIHLNINGQHYGSSKRDIINKYRRFEPIMGLMSNGRIQSLSLTDFTKFYKRVGDSAMLKALGLRKLSLTKGFSPKDEDSKAIFVGLLQNCPSLRELEFRAKNQFTLLELTLDNVGHLPKLETVTLQCSHSSASIRLLQSKIENAKVTVVNLSGLSPSEWDFLERGILTELSMEQTPALSEDSLLATILRANSTLAEIQIGCHASRTVHIIDQILIQREKILRSGRQCGLRTVLLRSDNSGYNCEQDAVIAQVRFEPGMAPEISFDVKMHEIKPRNERSPLSELFYRYGRSIKLLETNSTFNDNLALQLYTSTCYGEPVLTALTLNTISLTSLGLEHMGEVIGRSRHLECLHFFVNRLGIDNDQERMQRALSQHWEPRNEPASKHNRPDRPLSELLSAFPVRRDLPQLHTLRLLCSDARSVPTEWADWIKQMVSGPFMWGLLRSPFESFPLHVFRESPSQSTLRTWQLLRCLKLKRFNFEPKDWCTILKSIDYSELETLSFKGSNFSIEQLKVFVDCIRNTEVSRIPLLHINLGSTHLWHCHDVLEIQIQYTRLREKAPSAVIHDTQTQRYPKF
ncbi:hypothetical protein BGZ98_006830 [Dissophora globulifera]|nr:hypothetical protein BGZ98_006830 [Dissophora globulifera]